MVQVGASRFGVGEGSLHAHALGDIASDLRRADHASVPVLNRRNRDGNREQRPVFFLPDGLEVIDGLAAEDGAEDVVFFRLAVGGNDDADRSPDHLLGFPAEHPFGGLVPGDDDSVYILADDGIVGRLDDRGQAERGRVRRGLRDHERHCSRGRRRLRNSEPAPAARRSSEPGSGFGMGGLWPYGCTAPLPLP
jgi:hypothetical protein